jgi:hypothetical protein
MKTTLRMGAGGAVALVVLGACAHALRYRMPDTLRSYTIVVPARDSLSEQLARALRGHGIKVERRVRGGSGPSAALVHFVFRESQPAAVPRLLIRVADTRTGVIVGEAAIVLDSLGGAGAATAEAIIDSLGFEPRPSS